MSFVAAMAEPSSPPLGPFADDVYVLREMMACDDSLAVG